MRGAVASTRRVLFVVSVDLPEDLQPDPEGPRRDFVTLIEALRPTVLDRTQVRRSIIARLIARLAGVAAAQAWLAFLQHRQYDVLITDGEHIGIPLALMLKLVGARTPHLTIGHRLSTPKKRLFFRWLQVHSHITRIALHSKLQYEIATAELGIPKEQLVVIPWQADTTYWRPQPVPEERLVCSAGLEHRDYPTFFRGVEELDVPVIVGAASHWSRQPNTALGAQRPPNVDVDAFDYASLRDLFARSAVVVVPLFDVDFQAGVTTILEAMSMGKAVIVTQTSGQTDVVEDGHAQAHGILKCPRPTSLLRDLAEQAGIPLEPNGLYVPPNDPSALREAISYLLDRPEERARLGASARQTIERFMSVDHFADRVTSLVDGLVPPTGAISASERESPGLSSSPTVARPEPQGL